MYPSPQLLLLLLLPRLFITPPLKRDMLVPLQPLAEHPLARPLHRAGGEKMCYEFSAATTETCMMWGLGRKRKREATACSRSRKASGAGARAGAGAGAGAGEGAAARGKSSPATRAEACARAEGEAAAHITRDALQRRQRRAPAS
jgi:hypothetical protein